MINPNRKSTAAKRHAEVEDLEMFGLRTRFGSVGLHVYATDYLASARALPAMASLPFAPSRYFLACRALELALKALLSIKGQRLANLAGGQYAHDLSNLLDEAGNVGIGNVVTLGQDTREHIRDAAKYYGEKVLEYPALMEALSAYPHLPRNTSLLCDFTANCSTRSGYLVNRLDCQYPRCPGAVH